MYWLHEGPLSIISADHTCHRTISVDHCHNGDGRYRSFSWRRPIVSHYCLQKRIPTSGGSASLNIFGSYTLCHYPFLSRRINAVHGLDRQPSQSPQNVKIQQIKNVKKIYVGE